MTILADCGPSRWFDFLTISDGAAPTSLVEGTDLFIGKNKSITMTLVNGSETRFRDIVVLGELIIQSSNPANSVKPLVTARDVFTPGVLTLNHAKIDCRGFRVPKNIEEFRSNIQDLLLDWLSLQREAVNRIGLKSIFAQSF